MQATNMGLSLSTTEKTLENRIFNNLRGWYGPNLQYGISMHSGGECCMQVVA